MEGYAAYLGILQDVQTAVSLREPDIKCAFNGCHRIGKTKSGPEMRSYIGLDYHLVCTDCLRCSQMLGTLDRTKLAGWKRD